MGDLKQDYMRLKNELKSPQGRLIIFYLFWIIGMCVVVALLGAFVYNWPQITKKPEIESIEETDGQEESALVTYSYYLDYSPSMEGFISVPGGNMGRLTEVFRDINNGRSNDKFYRCSAEVNSCPSDIFYTCMSNSVQIRGDYEDIKRNGEPDKEISGIDLSKIFSQRDFSHDTDSLNVIVTDLNFYDDPNQSDTHDERMDAFMRGLANAAGNANISIYQVADDYEGIGIDDIELSSETRRNSDKASFFLIVFSENDLAYEEYIRRLELYLEHEKVTEFSKLELKNNLLQDSHSLAVDEVALYEEGASKVNFNFNNELIKDRKPYEIGFYKSGGNGVPASFQGNVAALEIDAFCENDQGSDNESKIDVRAKTWYYLDALSGLREYSGNGPLRTTSAGIVWDQNTKRYYLNIGVECSGSINLPRRLVLTKNYFAAELQFFIERPDYNVPQWLIDLDTEENALDLEKKRKIVGLVESLMAEKEACFEEYASEYDKYMGSLVIYVSY